MVYILQTDIANYLPAVDGRRVESRVYFQFALKDLDEARCDNDIVCSVVQLNQSLFTFEVRRVPGEHSYIYRNGQVIE